MARANQAMTEKYVAIQQENEELKAFITGDISNTRSQMLHLKKQIDAGELHLSVTLNDMFPAIKSVDDWLTSVGIRSNEH